MSENNDSIFDAEKWYLQNYPISVNSENNTSNILEGPLPTENSASKRKQLIKIIVIMIFVVSLFFAFGFAQRFLSNDDEYYNDSEITKGQTVFPETTIQESSELDTTSFEEESDTTVQMDKTESSVYHDSVNDDEDTTENPTTKKVTTTEDYNIEYAIGGSPENNPPDPEDYDNFDDYLDAYINYAYINWYNSETDDYDELYDEWYADAWDYFYN